jgi:hypothetical protein
LQYNFNNPAGANVILTQAYAEANWPLVEQRLVAGAIRLADVYNAAIEYFNVRCASADCVCVATAP